MGMVISMNSLGETLDAFAVNERIGRGINMGNMFESPRRRAWGRLDIAYFDLIKEAGFDSVRIPVRWSDYAAENAPFTIDRGFLKRIDEAIEQALKRNLIVILNVHHYAEFMEDPEGHTNRLLALWKQLSAHSKMLRVHFVLKYLMNRLTKSRQLYGTTCRTKPLS